MRICSCFGQDAHGAGAGDGGPRQPSSRQSGRLARRRRVHAASRSPDVRAPTRRRRSRSSSGGRGAGAAATGAGPQRQSTKAARARLPFSSAARAASTSAWVRASTAVNPSIARPFDRCAVLFEPHLGLDLRDDRLRRAGNPAINETRIAQPALFADEYALASLWMSRGIVPSAMLGHSIGEYVAAHLAGVMSLDDAHRRRGRAWAPHAGASRRARMAAVHLSASELGRCLAGSASGNRGAQRSGSLHGVRPGDAIAGPWQTTPGEWRGLPSAPHVACISLGDDGAGAGAVHRIA